MIGKGIATVGVWGSVAVVAIYAGGAAIFVAFFAFLATLGIWED